MTDFSNSSATNIINPFPSQSSDLDISDKTTLPSLLDEETKDIAPSFHHLSQHNFPSLRHDIMYNSEISSSSHHNPILTSPDSSPLVPRSPESKWSPSPPCTPSPPLLHRCISSLRHEGTIFSIVVSRGLVFTGSNSTYIRAWQPFDCREKGYVQTRSGKVRAMLAHGGMLFTAHKDHKIRVWNIICHGPKFRPKKITTLPKVSPLRFLISWNNSALQHKDTISCMAYNHGEGILYTGSWDKTVKAWSLNHRKCIDSFAAHADNINDMVINQDGFIFTCSSDGTLKMWNKVCGENFHTLTMTLTFHSYPIYALALSEALPAQTSNFLYAGSSDGCINIYEQQNSGRYNHEGCIQGHQFAVLCLATLDNLVISGSEDAMIKIWRGQDKIYECLAVLEGHKGPVKCIAACLEKENLVMGFLVFSASSDRTFKVWRVKVYPQEMRSNRNNNNQSLDYGDNQEDYDDDHHNNINVLSSPALSPTWVEKKLRLAGSSVFN